MDCNVETSGQFHSQDNKRKKISYSKDLNLKLEIPAKMNIYPDNQKIIIFGPPLDWDGPPPSSSCEIIIRNVPPECTAFEIFRLFGSLDLVYDMGVLVSTKAVGFPTILLRYQSCDAARRSTRIMRNYEIRPGWHLNVKLKLESKKLWICSLPDCCSSEDIKKEVSSLTSGVVNVLRYSSHLNKSKMRPYAFVEYESRQKAAEALRILRNSEFKVLGQLVRKVKWAEPENEVDSEIMSKVKILFLRNLLPTTTENVIWSKMEELSEFSEEVIRVKKIKDYAFVHFKTRQGAEKALQEAINLHIEGTLVEVCWSKPLTQQKGQRFQDTFHLNPPRFEWHYHHPEMSSFRCNVTNWSPIVLDSCGNSPSVYVHPFFHY